MDSGFIKRRVFLDVLRLQLPSVQMTEGMPTISIFFGIVIRMYYREHAPPHFHAIYGDQQAMIAIETLEVLEGRLTRRALNLVLDWAEMHRAELLENWRLAEERRPLHEIRPLE